MKTIDKEKNNDWIFINQWNGNCLTAEVGAEREVERTDDERLYPTH